MAPRGASGSYATYITAGAVASGSPQRIDALLRTAYSSSPAALRASA